MPPRKLLGVHLAAAVLGGCLLTVAAAHADPPSSTYGAAGEATSSPEQNVPIPFTAWVENGEFIGAEQLRRVYLAAGTNQFGFVLPEGLRVDVSHPDRITLTRSDLSFFLTVKIVTNASLGNDVLRAQALARYPDAQLLEESNLEAAGQRGPKFNLRWKPAGGVDRFVTMAFIPTTAGVLELDLVADQAKAGEAQNALSGLLCRFQSCSGGKLRMETFRQPDYN